MKRDSIIHSIKYSTRPYEKILASAVKGGWKISPCNKSGSVIDIHKTGEFPITLTFYDATKKELFSFNH